MVQNHTDLKDVLSFGENTLHFFEGDEGTPACLIYRGTGDDLFVSHAFVKRSLEAFKATETKANKPNAVGDADEVQEETSSN